MAVYGLVPTALDKFGGLQTLKSPASCSPSESPDCQDVVFPVGSVGTRPGTTLVHTLNSKINGLKTYTQNDLTELLMQFTSSGTLYKDITLVRSIPLTGALYNSATLLGREYIALSDGKVGSFPLLVYDGTNLDKAGAEGPKYFSSIPTAGDNGAGNISAGIHKVVVFFETRNGYYTSPNGINGYYSLWTAAGGKVVDLTVIPVGPPNTVRRILAFTAAAGSSFYYIPGSTMIINDNTTTIVSGIDFTDAQLLAGVNVDDLFRRVPIPPVAGVLGYANRLVMWGARNQMSNIDVIKAGAAQAGFLNLTFDGGFFNSSNPLGWGGAVAGYSREDTDVIAGNALKMTGDGATATKPSLTQAYFLDKSLIVPGKSYRCRAWVKRSSGLLAGRIRFYVDGITAVGLSVTATQASTTYQLFDAEFIAPADAITSAQLVYLLCDQTVTNNEYFLIDEIMVYPADQPYDQSDVLVSQVEDPEALDGISGRLSPAQGEGQAVRCCYVIRDFLYIAKEHSLFVTRDDGINEPSLWQISEVSDKVGTPSLRGVGDGDEWVIIAGESGVYYHDGGEPLCLSDEIQPPTSAGRIGWNGINWAYGHLLEVKVDTKRKRIYISVPYGSATQPDRQFVLDYKEGFAPGKRKWCPWIIPCNSMAIITPSGAPHELYIGSNDNSGDIWQLDEDADSDCGDAIDSYWQSGYFSSPTRKLLGYLSAAVSGIGVASLRLFRGSQSDYKDLRGWTLAEDPSHPLERQVQTLRDWFSVRIGTNYANHKFELTELSLFTRDADYSPVRGKNS